MDQKELEILHQSAGLFMKYGLKSLSMDDLARELKVSKKTLYKYFDDKDSMIARIMENFVAEEICDIEKICKTAPNAIEEVLEINQLLNQQLKDLNPSIHFDLEKYYRKAWEVFNDYKFNFIYNCVVNNIQRGIKEGLYRKSIRPEIIAKIYVLRVDYIIDGDVFPSEQFSFFTVNEEVMRYHLGGLVNEKGMEYLKNKGL